MNTHDYSLKGGVKLQALSQVAALWLRHEPGHTATITPH